ncbi:hypothetical protein LJC10_06070, partial [Selenomonadales bacterium OttesenSCG-928-I06]|nr:hypothetical protein [Selenomonadales bacterium OttesenSCG-928-I06]
MLPIYYLIFFSIILIVSLIALKIYYNKTETKLKKITSKIENLKNSGQLKPGSNNIAISDVILKKIYDIIYKELKKEDPKGLHQAIETLKFAFSQNVKGKNESINLIKLIFVCFNSNKIEAANNVLNAFPPLAQNASKEELVFIIENLSTITALTLKKKQNSLASRSIEIIFFSLEIMETHLVEDIDSLDVTNDAKFNFVLPVKKCLKLIARRILISGDMPLFREFCILTSDFLVKLNNDSLFKNTYPALLLSCLQFLSVKENDEILTIVLAHFKALVKENALNSEELEFIYNECSYFSSVFSINPERSFTQRVLSALINVSFERKNINILKIVISIIVSAGKMSLLRYPLEKVFLLLKQLLRKTRKTMLLILNKDFETNVDADFYKEAFVSSVNCILTILEYESRKNFLLTSVDIAIDIFKIWDASSKTEQVTEANTKLCQFLILSYLKNKETLSRQISYPPKEFLDKN